MSCRGLLVGLLVMLALGSRSAFAYLDGGSSSLLFQAAAAALFTLLFVLRTWWGRIRALFGRGNPRSSVRDTDSPPPPTSL